MPGLKAPTVGPVPTYGPELLAQMAQAAFRAPSPMSAPSLPSPPAAPSSNIDLMGAAKALADALEKWRERSRSPSLDAIRTANDADLNGYNGRPAVVDVGNGVMLPNPNIDFLSGAPPGISPEAWARLNGPRWP